MEDKRPNAQNFPKGISAPALRALHSVGITHIDQVSKLSQSELKGLHGMGPKAIEILMAELSHKKDKF